MIRFEIITCSADVNEEDPRALVTEYLLKDNYSSIMFKGSNSNDNKPKNTEYRSNTKRNVWSSSDSGVMNRKNAVSPSPSPIAKREITEEISDPDDEEIVEPSCTPNHDRYKLYPTVLPTWQHSQLRACPETNAIVPESQVL